jgi:hypothetical protein
VCICQLHNVKYSSGVGVDKVLPDMHHLTFLSQCRQTEGKLMKACRACSVRDARMVRSVWLLWHTITLGSRNRTVASSFIARLQSRLLLCRAVSAWRGSRLAKVSRVCRLLSDEVRTMKASLAVAQRHNKELLAAKEQLTKEAQETLGADSLTHAVYTPLCIVMLARVGFQCGTSTAMRTPWMVCSVTHSTPWCRGSGQMPCVANVMSHL